MKTIKTYLCDCGEDVYEDDRQCVSCHEEIDQTKFVEEEIPEIEEEIPEIKEIK